MGFIEEVINETIDETLDMIPDKDNNAGAKSSDSYKNRIFKLIDHYSLSICNGVFLVSLIWGLYDGFYTLGLIVAGIIFIVSGCLRRIHYIPLVSRSIQINSIFKRILCIILGVFCIIIGIVFQIIFH